MLPELKFDAVDAVVSGKIITILGELQMLPQSFFPLIWEKGMYRFYQVEVVTRDDEPFQMEKFRALLDRLNTVGTIKPQLYDVEDYAADHPNFSRYYVTLYI